MLQVPAAAWLLRPPCPRVFPSEVYTEAEVFMLPLQNPPCGGPTRIIEYTIINRYRCANVTERPGPTDGAE